MNIKTKRKKGGISYESKNKIFNTAELPAHPYDGSGTAAYGTGSVCGGYNFD